MSWPVATIGTTNIDAATDSPAIARADLKSAVDALNTMISHTEPLRIDGSNSMQADLVVNSGVVKVGKALTGLGGNLQSLDDTGVARFRTGLINSDKDWVIYDSQNAVKRMIAPWNIPKKMVVGNDYSLNSEAGLEIYQAAASSMVVRWYQGGVKERWNGMISGLTSLYWGNNSAVATIDAEMQDGGTFKMYGTAPKLVNRQSSQDIAELAFSIANSRGKVAITTRDTAGAAAVNVLESEQDASGSTWLRGTATSNPSSLLVSQSLIDLVCNNASTGAVRVLSASTFRPGTDNATSLGVSGGRWSAVWAANGTIQTSDLTDKRDVAEIDAALARQFVAGLRGISFRWVVGGVEVDEVEDGIELVEEQVERTDHEEREVGVVELIEVDDPEIKFEVADGLAVRRIVPRKRLVERPVIDVVPVVNELGEPVMRDVLNEVGEIVGQEQATIAVQRKRVERVEVKRVETIQVERPKKKTVRRELAGKRLHFGFGAQDVGALYKRVGLEDFGGHVIGEDGKQALRVDQLVPFLATALQAEMKRGDELQADIAALRKRLDRLDDGI